MKLSFGVIVAVLCITTQVSAQEGYKNYQWGQSVQQVSEIAGKLDELAVMFGRFPTPQLTLLCLYGNEFDNRVPDPMIHEGRDVSSFALEGSGDGFMMIPPLKFWFVGGELICVALSMFETPVLSTLEDRYGRSEMISGAMGSGYEFEAMAWTSGDRVILWDRPYGTPNMETVTYLSRPWFDSLVTQLRAERAQDAKSDQNRLD